MATGLSQRGDTGQVVQTVSYEYVQHDGHSLCLLNLPVFTGGFFTPSVSWEAPLVIYYCATMKYT